MRFFRNILRGAALAAGVVYLSMACAHGAQVKLLNVSYDVSREFYKDFNAAFAGYWKSKTGDTVTVDQSHGGSGKQARAVIDGLEADVVTMNQALDINAIARQSKFIAPNWRTRLPNNSAPYISTILFLVRKGNPKGIKNWDDLARPGVSVIIPNPKTSGNGRYSYLAAYGYALTTLGNDPSKARAFVTKIFDNVPILDTGGRGATTTFAQRGIGDVLLTFESEAFLAVKELGEDKFDVVAPPISIEAEAPVSLVDKNVDKHKTRDVAEAYLNYLYSEEGQEIAARHYLRPRLDAVLARHSKKFAKIRLLSIDNLFGGWDEAQKVHFSDGGLFDEIYKAKK